MSLDTNTTTCVRYRCSRCGREFQSLEEFVDHREGSGRFKTLRASRLIGKVVMTASPCKVTIGYITGYDECTCKLKGRFLYVGYNDNSLDCIRPEDSPRREHMVMYIQHRPRIAGRQDFVKAATGFLLQKFDNYLGSGEEVSEHIPHGCETVVRDVIRCPRCWRLFVSEKELGRHAAECDGKIDHDMRLRPYFRLSKPPSTFPEDSVCFCTLCRDCYETPVSTCTSKVLAIVPSSDFFRILLRNTDVEPSDAVFTELSAMRSDFEEEVRERLGRAYDAVVGKEAV